MSHSALPLDSDRVRALFPAFSEPTLMGQAFFDNAAGSYTSEHVLNRLDHYYRATKVQPYGVYNASIEAGQAMDLSYERMAAALGLPTDWIHIGPSTSANTYVLGHAFAKYLNSGDVVIVTNQDHEANAGAWHRLQAQGVVIREWQVDPQSGRLDLVDLDNLLDDKVKLVAFPHCSNIIGEINPAAKICARIRAAGAISIVDGVSYAPHGFPDLSEIGSDIYFFSAYKTYGPHQGIMAIRPELAAELPNQGHYFLGKKPRYRLTPAGPDHAQVAALSGVADYLEAIAEIAGPNVSGANPFRRAHNAMRQQEQALMVPLLDFLRARNDLRLLGPDQPEHRAPTISVVCDLPGAELAKRLADHNIMTAGGHFYAHRLIKALGIDPDHGVLRLSFVHYTTPGEIDALIDALCSELGRA